MGRLGNSDCFCCHDDQVCIHINQMKAWSGGQWECRHLPSCVTHLFVNACPPTLFYSITVCKDLHISDFFEAYWSYLVNLLLSPNSGPSCTRLLSSSAYQCGIYWLPLCLQNKTARWCSGGSKRGLFVLTTYSV